MEKVYTIEKAYESVKVNKETFLSLDTIDVIISYDYDYVKKVTDFQHRKIRVDKKIVLVDKSGSMLKEEKNIQFRGYFIDRVLDDFYKEEKNRSKYFYIKNLIESKGKKFWSKESVNKVLTAITSKKAITSKDLDKSILFFLEDYEVLSLVNRDALKSTCANTVYIYKLN